MATTLNRSDAINVSSRCDHGSPTDQDTTNPSSDEHLNIEAHLGDNQNGNAKERQSPLPPREDSSISTLSSDDAPSKQKEISTQRYWAEELRSYKDYVELLSTLHPRLQTVLNFITSDQTYEESGGQYGSKSMIPRAAIISGTSATAFSVRPRPNASGDGPWLGILELEEVLFSNRESALQELIVVAQDIQPLGVKYLGRTFHVSSFAFECYLNREASFVVHGTSSFVFDYPETYQSNQELLTTDPQDLFAKDPNSRPGTLTRMWKNTYGYFQRIVWIVSRDPKSTQHVHILLVDSLPTKTQPDVFHLSRDLGSYDLYLRDGALAIKDLEADTYIQLRNMMTTECHESPRSRYSTSHTRVAKAVIKLLRTKWGIFLQNVQEKISESKAPLSGDLGEIEEVLQRKHDFEKLQRVLSTVIASAEKAMASVGDTDYFEELRAYDRSISSWSAQLERVSGSMLGMLAVSESVKASGQAIRSKNLQILAFAFLPISTISSIYGMNTREINGGNLRTWQFGAAAGATLVLAVLVAAIYHSLPQPWFVAAISESPWYFLLDFFLLLTSFVLKTLFVTILGFPLICVVVIATLLVWIGVFLVCIFLTIIGICTLPYRGTRSKSELKNPLPPLALRFTIQFGVWIYLCLHRYWGPILDTIYFYDITRPLEFSPRKKSRRRWAWSRRNQKAVEKRRVPHNETKCVVM